MVGDPNGTPGVICIVVHALFGDPKKWCATISLHRCPRTQPFLDLFGKHLRIRRSVENLLRHQACGCMLTMPIGRPSNKDGANNQRPDGPDNANSLLENPFVPPLAQCLIERLGESIVSHRCEVLCIESVIPACLQKFFCSDKTERIPVIGGHHICTAFATIESQERNSCTLSSAFISERCSVLVIWMGNDHHEARTSMQFLQSLPGGRRSPVGWNRG